MIGFLVGFLPFVVCMLVARRIAHRGAARHAQSRAMRQPDAVTPPTIPSVPSVVLMPIAATGDTAVRDITPSAWTALDDLQLDRLLREASS